MTKHFCDRCGKEVEHGEFSVLTFHTGTDGNFFELCESCCAVIIKRINELKHKEATK